MRNSTRFVWLLAIVLAGSARAGDGRIEVNQATIDAAGGFPYYLTGANGSSYVLTGDVVSASAATTMLAVGAGVTLDLNGFTVRGPNVCTRPTTYDPANMTCSAAGNGVGVSLGNGATLRNGRVTGMGSYCIVGGNNADGGVIIEGVHADNCAGGGVNLYAGQIRNSHIANNGADGVTDCYCGAAGLSNIIENNVIVFNKSDGVGGQGEVRDNRISYNGGAGIKTSGTVHAVGNFIQSNAGRGIEIGGGSYLNNEIRSNASTPPGQVSGGTDAGGNVIH